MPPSPVRSPKSTLLAVLVPSFPPTRRFVPLFPTLLSTAPRVLGTRSASWCGVAGDWRADSRGQGSTLATTLIVISSRLTAPSKHRLKQIADVCLYSTPLATRSKAPMASVSPRSIVRTRSLPLRRSTRTLERPWPRPVSPRSPL